MRLLPIVRLLPRLRNSEAILCRAMPPAHRRVLATSSRDKD